MYNELYFKLKEMYDSFFNEQQMLKEKLDQNINRVMQIDAYLKSILEKEEEGFGFFSPRSIDSVYKEEVEKDELEKERIENENQYYYEEINILDSRIRTLGSVLNTFESYNSIINKEDISKKLHILDIQEKERQRIARDLHDTSLQNLTHLVHKLELTNMYLDDDVIKAKLELATVNKNLKSIIQEIRNTIFDFRPMTFDDLGLKESFQRLIDKLKESSDFDIQSEIEDIQCNNSLVLMTIFRIVEECMNNAVKHSCGKKIVLKLKREEDNYCCIMVSDDGKGFNYEEKFSAGDRHFGLCILKERIELLSGKIDINSQLDVGTTVKIYIPL